MLKKHLFTLIGLLFPALLMATPLPLDEVKSRLESMFPEAKITSIHPGPIPGIYEVISNYFVLYVSDDAKYIIQGDIVELGKKQLNLTEEKRRELRKNAVAQLKPSDLITFAAPHAKYNAYVFTDVDCGYCRHLQENVQEYLNKGINIHYLAFPRQGIQSEAGEKMISVWCADDKKEALATAMAGKNLSKKTCMNPVSAQMSLGMALGVNGTPAFLLENGALIPGLMKAEMLVQILEGKTDAP